MMVNCTSLDDVRIEILGSGAVTIPASLILAMHKAMKYTGECDETLTVEALEDEESGLVYWDAGVGKYEESGDSPWQAIKFLADRLEEERV